MDVNMEREHFRGFANKESTDCLASNLRSGPKALRDAEYLETVSDTSSRLVAATQEMSYATQELRLAQGTYATACEALAEAQEAMRKVLA